MSGAIHIVSLADRGITRIIGLREILDLSERLGAPVVFEHICLPPTPLLLSDLTFLDQNKGAAASPTLHAVQRVMRALRNCSFVLIDDVAEFGISSRQVYGVLSHDIERDPRTDLIAVRGQRYAAEHHRLPLTLVSGADLPMRGRDDVIQAFSLLIGKPIFRIATASIFEPFTSRWEFRRNSTVVGAAAGRHVCEGSELTHAIGEWALAERDALALSHAVPEKTSMLLNDDGHYCAHYTHEVRLRSVLDRFESYCVAGQPSSLPYIERYAAVHGKFCQRVAGYGADDLATLNAPCDIILSCGPRRRPEIARPMLAVMFGGWTAHGLDEALAASLDLNFRDEINPESNTDWHHTFSLSRNDAMDFSKRLEGLDLGSSQQLAADRKARFEHTIRMRREAHAIALAQRERRTKAPQSE